MPKSLIEIAYEYVSKKEGPVSFAEMWAYVCEQAGFDKETADSKVSRFYTNLMLDGRFVTLGENSWDLRTRHTFDKVHIDMKDVYSDVEAADDDEEEEEEDKEYNAAFEEPKESESGDEIEPDVTDVDTL